jgi:hypothetical protein
MLASEPDLPCVPVLLAGLPNRAQESAGFDSGTQHNDFGENPKASIHVL